MNNVLIKLLFITALMGSDPGLVCAESTDPEPLDLRIILDVSNKTRALLPQQKHLDALSVLIARLPDSTRAGVWTYGRYVNHLVQYGSVDHQWRLKAIAAVSGIRSVARYRNLTEALNQASYDRNRAGSRRHILLIAGGDPKIADEPEINRAELRSVRGQLLAELIKAGFVIHTLSVGKESTNLMRSLARETGGLNLSLEGADAIGSLVKLLGDYLLQPNSQQIINQQFRIDPDIENFNALLFDSSARARAYLQAPSGKLLGLNAANKGNSDHQPLETKDFRVIRVSNPEAGVWMVKDGAEPDNRIYIQSRKRLTIETVAADYLPGSNSQLVFAYPSAKALPHSALQLRLKPITGSGVSQETLLNANGDGNFVAKLGDLGGAGVYQLAAITGDTGNQRVLESTIQVIRPYQLSVEKKQGEDSLQYEIRVMLDEQDLIADHSSLTARVVRKGAVKNVTDAAGGGWQLKAVSRNGPNEWLLTLGDDGLSTHYEIEFDFEGVSFTGRKEAYRTKPLVIELERRSLPNIDIGPAQTNENTAGLSGRSEVAKDVRRVEMKPVLLEENLVKEGPQIFAWTKVSIAVLAMVMLAILLFWWRFFRKKEQATPCVADQQSLAITAVDSDRLQLPLPVTAAAPVMSADQSGAVDMAEFFEAPPGMDEMERNTELSAGLELAAEWRQLDIGPMGSDDRQKTQPPE